MDNATIQLSEDLARQDDVGLILRGHLHTEHALIELITFFLPIENRCDWSLISYRAKLEVAHACGLNRDVKFLLEKINTLRNTFSHKLVAGIEKKEIINIYNSMSELHRATLKDVYKLMTNKMFASPAKIIPHDLLTLIFIVVHADIKSHISNNSKFPKIHMKS